MLAPATQCDPPVQTSGDWHAPAQFPGEQWLGAGLSEQQPDAQSLSAVQPVQTYSPSIAAHDCPAPHFQPHTPQLVVLVVSTALPLQHRAFASPLFELVPSASAAPATH